MCVFVCLCVCVFVCVCVCVFVCVCVCVYLCVTNLSKCDNNYDIMKFISRMYLCLANLNFFPLSLLVSTGHAFMHFLYALMRNVFLLGLNNA